MFDPVPRLEAGSDPAAFCRAWATSDALAELVALAGGRGLDRTAPTAELLGWLDEFSSVWDRRGKKERNQALSAEMDPETELLVWSAMSALGLCDTSPPARARYDHVVILGGLTRGCLARPLHAARLIGSGAVSADCVTALTAFRELNAAEGPLLEAFGLTGASTEFDVMDFGVRRAFEPLGAPDVHGEWDGEDHRRWRVHRYAGGDGPGLQVAAAPAPGSGARANTGDTYTWLATSRGAFRPGDSLLIVTTFHYRVYQLADAIRLLGLPHDIEIDAVGMAPGDVDERLAWQPSASGMLQEVRSTIRALRALDAALS